MKNQRYKNDLPVLKYSSGLITKSLCSHPFDPSSLVDSALLWNFVFSVSNKYNTHGAVLPSIWITGGTRRTVDYWSCSELRKTTGTPGEKTASDSVATFQKCDRTPALHVTVRQYLCFPRGSAAKPKTSNSAKEKWADGTATSFVITVE